MAVTWGTGDLFKIVSISPYLPTRLIKLQRVSLSDPVMTMGRWSKWGVSFWMGFSPYRPNPGGLLGGLVGSGPKMVHFSKDYNDNEVSISAPSCIGYPLVDSVWYFMHMFPLKVYTSLMKPAVDLMRLGCGQVPALDESI